MIFHSSGSSLPGLLMISLGIAILPTSCSSAPNSRLRRCSALSPSRSASASARPDDALAVLAGVAVVGLDDVAQHERGPPVGGVQLEQTLEPLAPLAGEYRQQASSGSSASAPPEPRERPGPRPARCPRARRRSRRPTSRAAARRGSRRAAIASSQRRDHEVDDELRRQRGNQQQRRRRGAARCPRSRTPPPGRSRTTQLPTTQQQALGASSPRSTSASRAITSASTTASGTIASGIANSSGTNASWVGAVKPNGVSNSIGRQREHHQAHRRLDDRDLVRRVGGPQRRHGRRERRRGGGHRQPFPPGHARAAALQPSSEQRLLFKRGLDRHPARYRRARKVRLRSTREADDHPDHEHASTDAKRMPQIVAAETMTSPESAERARSASSHDLTRK